MKEQVSQREREPRTIQGSGMNQKIGFVDNRGKAIIQRMMGGGDDPNVEHNYAILCLYFTDWTTHVVRRIHAYPQEAEFKRRLEEYMIEKNVKKFAGHATADKSKKKQPKTESDFQAFKSWYDARY